MNSKTWKKLCGYEPGKEQKEMALNAVQDEGISIEEACSRMAMPPLYIEGINEPDPDEYDNPYRPGIVITTNKNI